MAFRRRGRGLRRRRPALRRIRRVRRRVGGHRRARIARGRRGAIQPNINKSVVVTDTVQLRIEPNVIFQFATNGIEAFAFSPSTNPNVAKSNCSRRMETFMAMYQQYKIVGVTFRFVQHATTFVATHTGDQFATKPYVYRRNFNDYPITMWKTPLVKDDPQWFRQQGCVGRPWGKTNMHVRFTPFMYKQSLLYDVQPYESNLPANNNTVPYNVIGTQVGTTLPMYQTQYASVVPQQVTRSPVLRTQMFLQKFTNGAGGINRFQGAIADPFTGTDQEVPPLGQSKKLYAPIQYGPYMLITQKKIPGDQDTTPYLVECRITVKFMKQRIMWAASQSNAPDLIAEPSRAEDAPEDTDVFDDEA